MSLVYAARPFWRYIVIKLVVALRRSRQSYLLPLLDECVVLRDALQRELVHQVDAVRVGDAPLHEPHHRVREGRGEEEDLPFRFAVVQHRLRRPYEVVAEKLEERSQS